MKKQRSLRDRFAAALEARGEVLVPHPSRRYLIYSQPRVPQMNYYLGRSGALRVGVTITGSLPASEKFRQQLLESQP